MTGLRPLVLCLWALLNTAFWAGIMHLIGLFITLPFGPAEWGALLIVIFVLSFIILLSVGIGRSNGGAPGREDG